MYYHPERKLAFLAQPHTGSHSIAHALMRQGFQVSDSRVFLERGELRRLGHHQSLWNNGIVTDENRKDWTAFSAVRNHFDLVLSRVWKLHRYADDLAFSVPQFEAVLKPSWWLRPNKLFGQFLPDTDRVMRYENLQSDLEEIVGPVDLLELIKNPKRKGRDYRDFYTPETRALVEERYGEEMAELGYSWE